MIARQVYGMEMLTDNSGPLIIEWYEIYLQYFLLVIFIC